MAILSPRVLTVKIFTICYTVFGIPLVFLTFANMGQFLAEFYWLLFTWITRRKEVITDALPLYITAFLLLTHSVIGGVIFHFWIDEMPFVAAIYFSFISITTIGYGDLTPTPDNTLHTFVIIAYLSFGIVIMSTLVASLSNYIRRLHYIGRSFTGDEDVQVWFGGSSMSIAELIQIVAGQFNVAPEKLREVIRELDAIIELAVDEESTTSADIASDNTRMTGDSLQVRKMTIGGGSAKSSIRTTTIYSSKFTDKEEHEKLIHALGTVYHAAKCGNRSFRKASTNSSQMHRVSTESDPHKRDQRAAECNDERQIKL